LAQVTYLQPTYSVNQTVWPTPDRSCISNIKVLINHVGGFIKKVHLGPETDHKREGGHIEDAYDPLTIIP
jgi:hypothetical protein